MGKKSIVAKTQDVGGSTNRKRPTRFFQKMSAADLDYLKQNYMEETPFAAGERIAWPGHELQGGYFIDSGVVAAADSGSSDSVWGGILLGPNCNFGEYALTDDRPAPTCLRALTDVKAWFLSRPQYDSDSLRAWRQKRTEVVDELHSRAKLNLLLPEIVRALARFPPFHGISLFRLAELAQLAEVTTLPAGKSLRWIGLVPEDWIYVAGGVVEGPRHLRFYRGSVLSFGPDSRVQHERQANEKVAKKGPKKSGKRAEQNQGTEFYRAPPRPPREGRAKDPPAKSPVDGKKGCDDERDIETLIVHIGKSLIEEVAQRSHRVAHAVGRQDRVAVEVVALFGKKEPRMMSALAAFIADSLRDVPDPCGGGIALIVLFRHDHPIDPKQLSRQLKRFVDLETDVVHVHFAGVSNGKEAARAVKHARRTFTVVDCSAIPEEWATGGLQEVLTKAVLIGPVDQRILEELRGIHLVRGVLLHEDPPGSYIAFDPGAVRLAFTSTATLEHTEALFQLPEIDRQSIGRLARAIAEVRVGIALGGGGAWGYAHVALLQELHKARLPIDVISGVSFGSLAGGFYAAGGFDALQTLVDNGLTFELSFALSGFSPLPRVARLFIDQALGWRRLEHLETPFFPVGLDLNTGEEWSLETGTVGMGVLQASELPVIRPSLIDVLRQKRSVDGGYINNVPESILLREQADFIIAADVVPPPVPTTETLRTVVSSVLNPFTRLSDMMRSVGVLMKVGNDRDAELSSARFLPDLAGVSPAAFGKAAEIVERTRFRAAQFAADTVKAYQTSTLLRADL